MFNIEYTFFTFICFHLTSTPLFLSFINIIITLLI
nr:MAG TPA: hypothetical protein [Caudoviricetes sp.]